jgi:tetratricopeptide (TPR) repeat protein/TolB-like protein
MSSLIEGYNYDIFISYRQKDNKGDKWVSEFVEALKTELESTFKEEISVYFDINPSDYLLESYDVGDSLKDKLKCLVFIPIISRTYCDPKSFAWEHEFKVFAAQASQDQFGLKIKLPNGNVASRILPVRIHDLDASDIKECESVLGGVLRGIEFIYREAGIDKPLTPGDDEKKNLNNTKYRIQLIKVAHAIKEIIIGMQKEPVQVINERGQTKESIQEINSDDESFKEEKSVLSTKRKLIPTIAVIILLVLAGIVTFPKIFKKNTIDKLRSSGERIVVAVMPFQNLTNDTINWNDYQYIIQTSLTSYLSNFPEYLQVRQTESIRDLLNSTGISNYASITPSMAGNISKKLNADVFIDGNIIKSGNVIRLIAQLKDSETGEIIKSFQIEGPSGEVNFLPEIDTLSGFIKDYLVISELKKGVGKEQTSDDFFQVTTNSPEAYKFYIYGLNAPDLQTTIEWFKRSVSVDSTFTLPYTTATWNYISAGKQGYLSAYDSAKKWCLEIYGRKDQAPLMQQLLIKSEYAFLFESSFEQNKYLQQILNNDDQQPITYYMLGANYLDMGELEKAISALNKGLGIYEKWGIKPSWLSSFYGSLLQSYYRTGRCEEGKKLVQKYQKDYPNANLNHRRAILSFIEGDTVNGNKYVEEWLSIQKKNSVSEVSLISDQLNIYSWGRMPDKAKEYCHKLLQTKNVSAVTLNGDAWILLFDERNANEALELAERALSLSPENYTSLHRKGWALYQLGRYREALEFMQKSWDIRQKTAAPYNHEMYLHLEAVKKAVAELK